ASEVANGLRAGTLPPFIGIRCKPFTPELRRRSLRTLELFLAALLKQTHGKLPPNFVVTYPKAIDPKQVTALCAWFDKFEREHRLKKGSLRLELMIETPQSIAILAELLRASRGRCVAAHFGVYDYTAALGITASHQ